MVLAFLARFQPMHVIHQKMIEKYNPEVILVGSSDEQRTVRNPFSFEERLEMIKTVFLNKKVLPLPDFNNNIKWLKSVEGYEIISNNHRVIDLLPKKSLIIPKRVEGFSSTIIRKKILAGENVRDYLDKNVFNYLVEIDGFEIIKKIG